jgi:hypothetical protein
MKDIMFTRPVATAGKKAGRQAVELSGKGMAGKQGSKWREAGLQAGDDWYSKHVYEEGGAQWDVSLSLPLNGLHAAAQLLLPHCSSRHIIQVYTGGGVFAQYSPTPSLLLTRLHAAAELLLAVLGVIVLLQLEVLL